MMSKNKINLKKVLMGLVLPIFISITPLYGVVSPAVSAKPVQCGDSRLSSNDIMFYDPCEQDCSTSGGSSSSSASSNSDISYKIPAEKGKAGLEEAINTQGQIPSGGKVTFSGHASKGQKYQDYYITMRWDYVDWNWDGTTGGYVDSEYLKWMQDEPRMVLVTNTRTGKSIYAVALEAGPAPWTGVDSSGSNNNPKQGWSNPQRGTPAEYKGRVSGFPPTAFDYLEIKQGMSDGSGDDLTYQWASDQSVEPGPTGDSVSGGTSGACGASSGVGGGFDLDGMVFFDQCDPRWATVNPVGGGQGSIGNYDNHCDCSCGPFSMSMIIATLTNNKNFNPSDFAVGQGSYLQPGGCGSAWNWEKGFSENGLKTVDIGKDMNKAKDIINQGGMVLFSWSGAPFTGGGHIMVIRGFTPGGKVLIASSGGEFNLQQSKEEWDVSIFENGFSGPYDGLPSRRVNNPGHLAGMWGVTK